MGEAKRKRNAMEGIKKPIEGFRKFVTRRPAIEEVVRETTSGGIVYRRDKATESVEILLIKDAKNRWTIPNIKNKNAARFQVLLGRCECGQHIFICRLIADDMKKGDDGVKRFI